MSQSDALLELIRKHLRGRRGIEERQMFGGHAFLVRGHMFCGTVQRQLVVRLGHEGTAAALGEPHTSEMDFTGSVIRTMVYVDTEPLDDQEIKSWIDRGLAFSRGLPAKKK